MKTILSLLIGLIYLNAPVQAQIIDIDSAQKIAGVISFTGYQSLFYPKIPKNLEHLPLRIKDGKLQQYDNNNWLNTESNILSNNISGDWSQFDVCGACVFVSDPVKLNLTLGKEYRGDTLALGRNSVIELGVKPIQETSLRHQYKIFLFKGDISNDQRNHLSSFNVYTDFHYFRIDRVFFISDNILLILASEEDEYMNYAIFYDVTKKVPVGFKTYSTLQYFPLSGEMSFGRPTPNIIANSPGFDPDNIEVTKIPLFDGKSLSPELRDTSLFETK